VVRRALRTHLVEIARLVAGELGYLNERGWQLDGADPGGLFALEKAFAFHAGEEFSARVVEERGHGGRTVKIELNGRAVSLDDEGTILALVDDEGLEEIRRAHKLFTEILN